MTGLQHGKAGAATDWPGLSLDACTLTGPSLQNMRWAISLMRCSRLTQHDRCSGGNMASSLGVRPNPLSTDWAAAQVLVCALSRDVQEAHED